MSNLSDKEIDRLSREAADSYEPDSSSLSWTSLEQMLIEQMPERPPDSFSFGRIKPYIWGSAIMLLAGASFFFIKNNNYSQHSTRTNEPANQISILPSADSSRFKVNTQPVVNSSSAENTGSTDSQNKNSTNQLSGASSQIGKTGRDGLQPDENSTDAQQTEVHIRKQSGSAGNPGGNTESKDRHSGNNTPSTSVLMAGTLASGKNMANQAGTPTGVAETKTTSVSPDRDQASGALVSGASLTVSSTTKTGQSSKETSSHNLPSLVYSGIGLGQVSGNDSLLNKLSQPSPTPRKSLHINRSLNIGLAFGPDYTDAGGIPNNQLSNNIGITLGYYLTSRLSVNTGLYYSNKFFWSPGHGSGSQANIWPPPTRPPGYYSPAGAYAPEIEYVNGACNMYELPLTLRYDFADNDRTKFFVNAGLSSYFMLKQTYIYFFHSGGRPLAWKTNVESQSNYWFGMGDLSFGLETDMGKGFSFQAEPFFRIPLQKMGIENLKMYSYGFMISFRYAPVLSRTKK